MSISRAIIARLRVGIAALLLGVGLAGAAAAQTYTYSITASRPNLGDVSSGASGDTIFDVTSGGVITKVSGSGSRITTGTSVATITVSCGNQNACNSTTMAVTVTATGSQTGRAGVLTDFDAGGGTATVSNEVIGANSTTFTLGAIGKNGNKTFNLGLQMPIKSTGTTGTAQSSFLVTLNAAAGNDGSLTGTAVANVVRSLSLSENSALSFGAMVRPSSGSSTVTIDATTGARAFTGAAVGIAAPAATRATYTVTGEGARAVSITVPTTITLTRSGGGTLTITTTKTFSGTPSLSGSTGADGSYSFGVGGSMPITSSTSPGSYTGAFTITATYN